LKKKSKKKLYSLFWVITFMGFALGLGWHLSNRPTLRPEAKSLESPESGGVVALSEEKEPSPEENRALPAISAEELAFRERATEVLKDFPRKEILKERGRDLHQPPKELGEAAQELGVVEDLLEKNPSLLREGLRFYRKCALSEPLLTSLRALCLHNLKERAKKSGVEKNIRWSDFPENLHRIADKL